MLSTLDGQKFKKKSRKNIVILFTNKERENIFLLKDDENLVFNYSQHYFNIIEKEILLFY